MSSLEQEHLDVLVVGDDAVVHNQELVPLVTPLWVTVHLIGDSVGRPASVGDTCGMLR